MMRRPPTTLASDSEAKPDHVMILGVRIDALDEETTLTQITGFIESGKPHHIVTVNPEFIIEAGENLQFAKVLAKADLATADGFGILLAARYLGTPLPGRITGVELSLRLAELAAARGYRLFLLGAAPGVAEAAAAILQQRHPELIIAGTFAGSPRPEHEPFLHQLIRAAKPDILLVAYGHPQQDLWIARNQPELQVPLAIGVGGVFDYLSGRVPRAPGWLRTLGLEWLYRLIRQPRRWKRIINAVPRFMLTVLLHAKRK